MPPPPHVHKHTQVFDERFGDPRATSEERFLWDYFHIPNQYTMHRTQVSNSCSWSVDASAAIDTACTVPLHQLCAELELSRKHCSWATS